MQKNEISFNECCNKAAYYRYLYLKHQHDFGKAPLDVVNDNLACYCAKHDQAISDAENIFANSSQSKKSDIINNLKNLLANIKNNKGKNYFDAKKDVLLELISSFSKTIGETSINDCNVRKK